MAFDIKKILEHELVPPHVVLKKKEAEEVMRRYGATADQFPKISSEDPVVKAIGAKKGDMIKIIRKSPTAGEAVYYRVVV